MSLHSINPAPSAWLKRFVHLIPQGEVLDLASGAGRNCAVLRKAGHAVLALDRDPELLKQAAKLGAATLCHDLEAESAIWPFAVGRFAGIVICNYLHRALFPSILASLAPGGVLIIETFGQGNEQFGKPSNPRFLLAPEELLDLARFAPDQPLRVVAYESGYVDSPKPAIIQRVCLVKAAVNHSPLGEIH